MLMPDEKIGIGIGRELARSAERHMRIGLGDIALSAENLGIGIRIETFRALGLVLQDQGLLLLERQAGRGAGLDAGATCAKAAAAGPSGADTSAAETGANTGGNATSCPDRAADSTTKIDGLARNGHAGECKDGRSCQ